MAEIRSFRGVRYNRDQINDLSAVVAPPYDVVSAAMRQRLAEASPYNVIQLELPQGEGGRDAYQTAAELYQQWLAAGVLKREAIPALYPYAQSYRLPTGEERTRAGILLLLRLHDYGERIVLPHEQTLPKAKEDRYRLLSTARAQFSPIFGIYDPGSHPIRSWLDEAMRGDPALDLVDPEQSIQPVEAATAMAGHVTPDDLAQTDVVRHRLWVCEDDALLRQLAEALAQQQVFIVDGHHRYETALRHRREHGEAEPWANFVMIYLVAMNDTGLAIFPTHRIVSGLSGVDWDVARHQLAKEFNFDTHPILAPADPVRIADRLSGSLKHGTMGMLAPPFDRVEILTLRDWAAVDSRVGRDRSEAWRRLDVVALHELVIAGALGIGETRSETSGVSYTRDPVEAVEAVLDQPDRAAFFVAAPTVAEVRAVALAGERMPEKSTYFWPKVATGLVIYDQHGIIPE